MKIDVYGAIFYDIYIVGDEVHNSEIIEIPGGSGFNIAYTLFKLGYEITLNAFIGKDFKGRYLEEIIPFKLQKVSGKTATFISKNEKPIAVERKINDNDFGKIEKKSNIAVITTELSRNMLIKIEKMNYDRVFFDIGPRPFISKNILKNSFTIGNSKECKIRKCNVIKMGKDGVIYNNKIYHSNGKKAKYSIGLGDIFDAFFIHYNLMGNSFEKSIEKSIKEVERVLNIPGAFNKINCII
ncbi:PfkB family carbohydrate kinase [Marinitoga arctica]